MSETKKPRIVGMIPCRLGSQRIPKKNLRLLNGLTLSQWVGRAAKQSGVLDDVYINSESTIFEKIAKDQNLKFYRRPEHLASNSATNDDFALDFMNNVPCDILVQINPTSPFMSAETIREFVDYFLKGNYQTLHTVKEERIEGIFKGQPLSFDPIKQMPPSQELEPVYVFSSSVMAWDANKFRSNMQKYGAAVYGGDGKIGYYTLKGFSALDIDNEKDFVLAEVIAKSLEQPVTEKLYYEG